MERAGMWLQTNRLLEAITNNATVAVLVMDHRQHCVMMNPAAERLTGFTLAEVQGKPLHDFVHHLHPDGTPYPLHDCPIDRAFPERNRMQGEEVFVHKDGHFYDVAFTASPLRDDAGKPYGTIIEVQDITVTKAQQAIAERSRQLFLDIVERAPFGMYIVDSHLRLIHLNEGSKTGAFQHVENVIGSGLVEAMRVQWPEDVAAQVVAQFRRTLETGEPYYSQDFRNPRRDISAVQAYVWQLRRITLPDGELGVICYYFDLTRLRDAEVALREADRRKDEFLAVLAHELRNPLAPIRTAVALQRTRPVNDPLLTRCRDVIDRQVTQMTRLLDDLLDVSRLSRGVLTLQRALVSLAAVLDAAVETSRPEIDKYSCSLSVEPVPADVFVNGDLTRLTQVFANLLNNAAKYNQPGGTVDVGIQVDISRLAAVVRVSDTGRGIAPQFLPRLFELFARDAGRGSGAGGLGIGLHLSKRLVELHDGRIEAVSAGQGRGSEFVVTLPIVISTAPIAEHGGEAPADLPADLHVLIAEDNSDAADLLTAFFQEHGCRVTTVRDGCAAVSAAETVRPDVAILDIGMPGIDGNEACARIRAADWGRTIRLIALTGWGQSDDRRRSRSAGFDLHLVKPVDMDRLLAAVRRLLAPESDGRDAAN